MIDDAFAKFPENQAAYLRCLVELIENPELDESNLVDFGVTLDELSRDDLRKQLLAMPFEFRAKAYLCSEKRFNVFGKQPVFAEGPDYGKAAGPVRPIACPEPPQDGAHFAFCWLIGATWCSEKLPDSVRSMLLTKKPESRIPIRERIAEAQQTLSVLEDPTERFNHYYGVLQEAALPGREKQTASIRNLIDSMNSLPADLKQMMARAFVAGTEFSREILYPQADDAITRQLVIQKSDWPGIMSHARTRHGEKVSEKRLLTLLGCRNADLPRTSSAALQFDWPFTPPISRKQFHETFRDSAETLKTLRFTSDEAIDSFLSQNLKRSDGRRQAAGRKIKANANAAELKKAKDLEQGLRAVSKKREIG